METLVVLFFEVILPAIGLVLIQRVIRLFLNRQSANGSHKLDQTVGSFSSKTTKQFFRFIPLDLSIIFPKYVFMYIMPKSLTW